MRSNSESISHYKDSDIYEGVTMFVLNGVHHENWEGYKGTVMYCGCTTDRGRFSSLSVPKRCRLKGMLPPPAVRIS